MKKALKITMGTALAVSALTPVAAFAAEDVTTATKAKDGFYNIETGAFYTASEFKALTKAEQKAVIKDTNFYLVFNGTVYSGLDIALKTTEELDAAGLAEEAFEAEKEVELTEDGKVLDKDGNVIGDGDNEVPELAVESVSAINNTLIQVTFNNDVEDIKASNITLSSGTIEGVTVSGKVVSVKVKGLNFGQEVTVGVTGVAGAADHSQTVKVPTVNELYTLDMVADSDTIKSDGLSKTMITVTLKEKATGEVVKTDAVVQFTTTRGALAQPEVSFQNGSASVQLTSVASPTSVPAIVTAVIAEAPDAAQYIGLTNQKNITFSPDAIEDGTVTFVQAVGVQARQGDRLQVDFSSDITAADYKKAVLGNSTLTWKDLATVGTSAGIEINDEVVRVKDVQNVTSRTLEFILDTDTAGSLKPTTNRIEVGFTGNLSAPNYLRDNVEHTISFPGDLGNLVRKNDGLKFVMADTSKPRVFGVEAKNQLQVDIRFSEAMAEDLVEGIDGDVNPNFKLNGQAVRLYDQANQPTSAQIAAAKAANEIIVTELSVGNYDVAKAEDTRNIVSIKVHKDFKLVPGAHTVQVSNVGDWAGIVDKPANIVTTQTFDFTVVADTNAPAPTVVAQSPEQWLVTFDRNAESVDTKNAKDAFVIHTAEGYGKNPKEALVMGVDYDVFSIDKDGFAGPLLNPNAPVVAHDRFLIEFKQDWTQKLLSGTTNIGYWHSKLNPYKFSFDNLESEFGVKMEAQVKDIALTYDGVSPTITSAVDIDTLGKKTANGVTVSGSGQKVLVKMSEPVQMPTSTNRTPSQEQAAGDGIPVPTFEFVKGDKTVKGSYEALAIDDQSFVVKPATALEAGEWTLYIKSISDDVGNTSATVSTKVTVPQTQATVTDTKIAWAGFDNNAGTNASDYDYVYIKFTKVMKAGGANGVAATTNYVFQGNELPAGSEVLKGIKGVTNDWDGVTIRMAKGTWDGEATSPSSKFTSIVSVANNFEAADGEKLSTPFAVEMKHTSNTSAANNDMLFEAFYGAYSATGSAVKDAGIVVGTNVYPVIEAGVTDAGIVKNADGKNVINEITVKLPVATTGTFATGQEVLVNGKAYTVAHTVGTATATLTAKTVGTNVDGVEGTATTALKITAKNGAIIVNTGLVADTAKPVIETATLSADKTKITITFSEAVTNLTNGVFEKLDVTDFNLTGLTGSVSATAIEHNAGTPNQVVLTLDAPANAALATDMINVVANTLPGNTGVFDFKGNIAIDGDTVTLKDGAVAVTGAASVVTPSVPYAAAGSVTPDAPATITGNDIVYTAVADGIALNGKTITVTQGGTADTTVEASVLTIDGSGNFAFVIGDKADDSTAAGTKAELLAEIQAAITAYDLANVATPAGITAALDAGAIGTDAAIVALTATLAGGSVLNPGTDTAAEYTFSLTANPVANETVTVGGKTYTFVTGTPAAGQVELGASAALTAANLAAVIDADLGNTYSATEAAGTITLKQRVAAAGAAPTVVIAN